MKVFSAINQMGSATPLKKNLITSQKSNRLLRRKSGETPRRRKTQGNARQEKTLYAAEKEREEVQEKRVEFWSKVKALLRKTAARTYQDLIDGITNAILKVTQENIRNWFAHCCYCTS
jgi:hypothetical protein